MTQQTKWFTTLSFVVLIFLIPLVQAIKELAVDKETPHIVSLFTSIPTEKNLRNFENTLEDVSIFESAIKHKMHGLLYKYAGDGGAKALIGKDDWLFYMTSLDYLTGPYYDDSRIVKSVSVAPKADWQAIECIVDFKEQLEARGIKLLLVPAPAKLSLFPEKATNSKIENPKSMYAHTTRFIKEVEARGVEVVDLFEPLLNEREQNDACTTEEIYLKRDTHWSPRGLKVVANVIADRVRKLSFWNDSLSSMVYSLDDTLVHRLGDIGEMTKMEGREKYFPKEDILAYRVIDSNGVAYKDNKKSPILWIGDSFSRIFQKDSPKSAGVVSHLAHELGMPLATIINDGGASTLVRQQLSRKSKRLLPGKKLVIWEFAERDIRFGMKGWKKITLK